MHYGIDGGEAAMGEKSKEGKKNPTTQTKLVRDDDGIGGKSNVREKQKIESKT